MTGAATRLKTDTVVLIVLSPERYLVILNSAVAFKLGRDF
jgi:hypothetical protein